MPTGAKVCVKLCSYILSQVHYSPTPSAAWHIHAFTLGVLVLHYANVLYLGFQRSANSVALKGLLDCLGLGDG